MKAARQHKYGPPEVMAIEDVEKPTPGDSEVLIRVFATTVNRTDSGFRAANPFITRIFTGLAKPKKGILGNEFAGQVEAVGKDVTSFKAGDRVFGFNDFTFGGHAEYMTTPANGAIATIPDKLSYEDAAPIAEGAQYALNGIRSAKVTKGHQVLVYGATGGIGSAAVQILKAMGTEVTAVCGTKNVELIKSLGINDVIDYQTQDFTKTDKQYDFVMDAVGKSTYGVCKKLLKPHGIYCSTELGPKGQNPLLAIWFAITGSRRVIFPVPQATKEKVEYLKSLVEAGEYKPLVDRTYSLEEIVEAAKYVETGQKVGNVVIKVS